MCSEGLKAVFLGRGVGVVRGLAIEVAVEPVDDGDILLLPAFAGGRHLVTRIYTDVYLVGFKAEFALSDEELINRSHKRMIEVGMDLIVANDVSRKNTGFGTDTNEVFIIDPAKKVDHISLASKYEVASKIIDRILAKIL